MSENRIRYNIPNDQPVSTPRHRRYRRLSPIQLNAENELLVQQSLDRAAETNELRLKIREMEFTIMRLSDKLAILTSAAREVIAADEAILAIGGFDPAKDFRFERAINDLKNIVRGN
jgi:hypothetical protein